MNYDQLLGWSAYIAGLICYVSICTAVGIALGGNMAWIMPVAGFIGWTAAALVVRRVYR